MKQTKNFKKTSIFALEVPNRVTTHTHIIYGHGTKVPNVRDSTFESDVKKIFQKTSILVLR